MAGRRVAVGGGGLLAGPRLQAAPDGAAFVTVVERAATPLHIVQQAFLLGPQLLVALLQPSAFFVHSLLQASLLCLQSLLVLRLALLLRVAVAQVHLGQVRHDEANDQHALAGQPSLAAEGDGEEAVEQHEAYQPKLVSEPQAVRPVHQRSHHASYGPFVMQRHGSTCRASRSTYAINVNGHDQHHQHCPGPRPQALATHPVVHAVDQHAAN
eukprot:scaffold76815_cov57-Phaeocystis_antarctica.AAC.4